MADAALVLGPVLFSGYEIPEKINIGGRHTLAVQKLMGGTRVVDAMGPDHAEITWSGRFQGSNASSRARELDALRQAGAQLTLAWGGFIYTVVVSEFHADFERFYQIPYRISCTVVTDATSIGASALTASVDALVSGDLAAVVAAAGSVASAALSGAVTSVSGAINAAGSLAAATKSTIATLESSVSAAVSTAKAASASLDVSIDVGTPASGSDPGSAATSLAATLAAIQAQSATQDVQSGLQRIYANLATQSA